MLYLAMELLEGEDLAHCLKRCGPLDVEMVADIMVPTAAAIAVAHEEGIIHRDLKPANVFLARGREGETIPKVLDFGISKLLDRPAAADLTSSGALLGTPYYMSPEQARGAKVITAASDQYTLGVILYECVTGQRAFRGEAIFDVLSSIVAGRFDRPRALRPDLPEAFEALISKAMAVEPSERYPSVRALGRALLEFAGERTKAVWAPFFRVRGPVSLSSMPAVKEAVTYSEPIADSNTKNLAFSDSQMLAVGRPRPGKGRWIWAGMLAVILGTGAAFALARHHEEESTPIAVPITEPVQPVQPAPKVYRIHVTALPDTAKIELDGQAVPSGKLDRELPQDGKQHTIEVSAQGYESTRIVFLDAPPPNRIELTKMPEPKAPPAKVAPKKVKAPPPKIVEVKPEKKPEKKPESDHKLGDPGLSQEY
jgi:serine/threonine-protein kinase